MMVDKATFWYRSSHNRWLRFGRVVWLFYAANLLPGFAATTRDETATA